jgi:hypothetical protein
VAVVVEGAVVYLIRDFFGLTNQSLCLMVVFSIFSLFSYLITTNSEVGERERVWVLFLMAFWLIFFGWTNLMKPCRPPPTAVWKGGGGKRY